MIKIGDKVKVKSNVNSMWVSAGEQFVALGVSLCQKTSEALVKVSEHLPLIKESDLMVIGESKSRTRRQWLVINKNTGFIVGHAAYSSHAASIRKGLDKPYNFMIKPVEVVY